MILIEKSKVGRLIFCKIDKNITFMLLNKIFDYLDSIEKDAVWWSFKVKYLIGRVLKSIHN